MIDRRNSGDEAEGGGEQRLGDARRDDGEVRRLRFGDADEAVHDAPHGAEQSDERRRRADGRQHARAAVDVAAGGQLDAVEAGGDALLDGVLVGDVPRGARFGDGGAQHRRHSAALGVDEARASAMELAAAELAQRIAHAPLGGPQLDRSSPATPSR